MKTHQILITRLPYAEEYDPAPILKASEKVDPRGLICLSLPIHVENPINGTKLVAKLEEGGLSIVALCCWLRDRHIVTIKSRRLTNAWEPIAIMSRDKDYHLNRDAAAKIKKGFEGREAAFDEDEFLTCVGDHWPIRNDRRDRRYLPGMIVMNCGQLADLQEGDSVLDPYCNPGVRDACKGFGWKYVDGGLPSPFRKRVKK